MSRHKIVRMMNLADELDDFDGEDDYYGEEDEGMSPADKARMADGLKRVREVIGSDVPSLTDEKIEETLWYYYFDVERSITYLLNQVGATEKKKQKKPVVPEPKVREYFMALSLPLSKNIRPGFWDDTPFGGVPLARQGRLLPPPPLVGFRTSGLLGGMQSGKVSKLAALAKARNKAKAEKAADSASPTTSGTAVSLLDRLSKKKPDPPPITLATPVSTISIIPNISKLEQLVEKAIPDPPKNEPVQNEPSIPGPEPDALLKASPSGFAKSMFGERISGPFDFKEEFTDAQLIYFSIAPTQKAAIKAKQAFDVPSPDDVVIAAQSQSKGISKSAKGEKAGGNTTASIQKGHVDAGKSTLMGRLLYDSGVVDERTIQKYKQEAEKIGKSSFALAWVLDQTGEERARGVTIDIAVNAFETERGRFTILDAPGHRDFIPNMIAGAAQADFAVLVIDSSPGEFEAGFNVRGQTKEHALLVRSMGVQRIIVAVNKLDLMHWDQDRFDEIKQQMSQFLTTAGFQPKNVSFIPCSGLTGDNIVRKPADGLISWYSGPTLVEELETAKPVIKAIEKPLRMTIADVYRGGVINPVTISGRIEVGNVQVGDTIVAIPGDEKAIVKGIEVDNQTAEWAVAGNNVQLHLANIEMEYLKIGDVICQADNPLVPLKEFEAKILAFEGLTPMMIDIHRGRLNASGRITKLVATLDKGNGSVMKKKPRHIGPGSLAIVNIAVTGAPLPLEKGSKIVLRADGLTVAAGVVE
ncbi:Hsp70 suppressor, GTPase facilitates ribosomal subunit dissociation [Orbilia oligospora]|uniref:Elongation factor 1 alpha-like protein n=1 Tax=Orbilia oligospora TaxID=2813651 RepID=A0A7C8QYJ6_ORBOL|nr:Hsp70 suppressor, GTPase facilitates ribosomal subunit dissociation [Orbilia oligospora]